MLKDMFEFVMSVQSMDQNVLDATGRTNIPAAEYKKMNNETREKLVDFYKQHNERFFKTIQKKYEWDF